MSTDLNNTGWFTSTRSGSAGHCVEVAFLENAVAVRDTKNRSKPAHLYTYTEWAAFIGGVKGGEFDLG